MTIMTEGLEIRGIPILPTKRYGGDMIDFRFITCHSSIAKATLLIPAPNQFPQAIPREPRPIHLSMACRTIMAISASQSNPTHETTLMGVRIFEPAHLVGWRRN